MKNFKITPFNVAILLCFSLLFCLSLSSASFASPRRVEECGVERYVAKSDPICGVKSYLPARDSICGAELYREGKSMACPGSLPEDEYIASSHATNDRAQCKPGYQKSVEERGGNMPLDFFSTTPKLLSVSFVDYRGPWYTVTCTRPPQPATCRLPEFGVELYKSCRDPKFGVESYNTCERPEFGVAAYKECEIRKTKAELTTYIQNLDQNIDVMGVALLTNEATLLKSESSEIGLACFIKRWDPDPLYIDLVAELKTQFIALFGTNYDPNNYNCSNQAKVTIPTNACDANEATPRCKASRGYKAARENLETNKAEVAALINDVVARSDAGFKQQLESLDSRIQNFLK